MDVHMDAFLELARPGHRGNSGGGKPPPPMVPSMLHVDAVAIPEKVVPAHAILQEGGGAEAMSVVSGGGKGGNLNGVQRLWAPPLRR